MKRKRSLQIKAALLLTVFSLNMVIGFACAVGMDMGNRKDHNDRNEIIIQKTSHHEDKACHNGANGCDRKSKDNKDNCCNESIIKFAKVDKLRTQSQNFALSLLFFPAFIFLYHNSVLPGSQVFKSIKYFVRSYHPPISNIRIAIHRFQI